MIWVTPLAGVWIEMILPACLIPMYPSLPLRECGLKFLLLAALRMWLYVTPLAGVWIEIFENQLWKSTVDNVTPLAGVWIEMPES